jgi:hypothetical protein
MIRIIQATWLTGFLFVVTGCAPVVINTNMLQPGKFDQASQFRKIAVLPFDGPDGRSFSSEIEAKLASITIEDKPYFELIDRAATDKILQEMKLSMTGLVDSSTAAQVGKMVGAKAIYTGAITASAVADSRYSENRKRCLYQVTKKDRNGKTYQECGKYQDYAVACTKRSAKFAFTPKLIEVQTGKIIYSNVLERDSSSNACSDSQKPLKTAVDLKREAQDAVKEEFSNDVAPHFVAMRITLMDSTSDIDSSAAANKFKSGLEFAKNNRLDRACELWSDAKLLASKSTSILYNLGVCAEVGGKLDEALALYKQTDRLMAKPDKRVTAALSRVNDSIKKQKKLNQQVTTK